MVVGYIRVSSSKQTIENQRTEILSYAQKQGILINEFIEVEISSRKSISERKLDLFNKLKSGDVIIASELSRFGRSISELLQLVKTLIDNGITIIFIKQHMVLDVNNKDDIGNKVLLSTFSLLAELERDFISQRTKEALKAKKEQGVILGKPKGTIQSSIYDKDINKIKELLGYGMPIRRISAVLGYGSHASLSNFIKSRKINC